MRGKVAVAQLDGKKIVAAFESQTQAMALTSVDAASIRKVIAGKRNTAGGYSWNTVNLDKLAKKADKKGLIVQRDKEGNVLALFDSATTAHQYTGIKTKVIEDNIAGKQKTAGGYVWS